ncbi:hypothetical protein ACFL6R_06460 [Gemmatimonadota bacterium]
MKAMIVGVLMLGLSPSPGMCYGQEATLQNGLALLERGVNILEVDPIMEAAGIFDRISEAGDVRRVARYYHALAEYRMANILIETGRRDAVRMLNSAIERLEGLSEDHPDWAESLALLAGCYGQKISLRPLQAITLGSKFNAAMDRAEELAPDNPRVVLFRAIGRLNAPGAFGGDREAAMTGFRRADMLFSKQPVAGGDEPVWGHEDTLAWMGIAWRDAGETEEARQAFTRVLALNPEYGWVKDILLPGLPPR